MKVDTINQFMLSLFFIYLLLMSSDISSLLNCNTQKFLKENNIIKHAILFASIFILTFILNWYTPGSIVVKDEEEEEKESFQGMEQFVFSTKRYNYLIQSLAYSFFIYLVFISSSKMDAFYFVIFVSILIFAFIIFLLYKVNLSELNIDELIPEGLFMFKSTLIKNLEGTTESIEENKAEMNNVIILYNILTISYLSLIAVMGIGVYKYYKRSYSNVSFKNITNFLYSTNKC
jgi:hypothetical protein